jgi:hypothetical protein
MVCYLNDKKKGKITINYHNKKYLKSVVTFWLRYAYATKANDAANAANAAVVLLTIGLLTIGLLTIWLLAIVLLAEIKLMQLK